MAVQINWKDLEERLQKASIENPRADSSKNGHVPIYICWPAENTESASKQGNMTKMVIVMVGVLLGGLILGILMARFMLPW